MAIIVLRSLPTVGRGFFCSLPLGMRRKLGKKTVSGETAPGEACVSGCTAPEVPRDCELSCALRETSVSWRIS